MISVGWIWSNWMSAVRVVAPQSTIEQLSYGMFVYTGRTQTAWATEIEIKSDPTYTYSNSSHLVWYSSVAYRASRSPFANENKKRKTTAHKTICIFFLHFDDWLFPHIEFIINSQLRFKRMFTLVIYNVWLCVVIFCLCLSYHVSITLL